MKLSKALGYRDQQDKLDIINALLDQGEYSGGVLLSKSEIIEMIEYIKEHGLLGDINKDIFDVTDHDLFFRFLNHHLEALRDEKNGLIQYNGIYIDFDKKVVMTHELWA